MSTPAVFLDRDDTLIHNDGDLGDPELVKLIQGAASACASLRGLGYRLVVVTNQGGVARGKYGTKDVDAVNDRIEQLILKNSGAKIDKFYYCPYHPEGSVAEYTREHPWRKPQPGMLLAGAKELDIDLSQSWMIGDAMRDIAAGIAAGTRTILLGKVPEGTPAGARPTAVATSLIDAARIIATHRKPEVAEVEEPAPKKPKPAPQKPTEAARSAAHEVELNPHRAGPKGKSFRPWGAPPPKEQPMSDDAPATPPAEASPPSTRAETKPPSPPPPAPTPEKAEPAPARTPTPSVPVADDSTVLRQILQELRGQRGGNSDFAYTRMFAVVLQMVAIVCFAWALYVSGDDMTLFLKTLGASLMLQLGTIAMLLYGK